MKKLIFSVVLSLTFLAASYADEGMWLPHLLKKLNIADMQAKGLKLSAEDIYDVNNSSLKDAIVIFGGGCTGEIISDQGLLLTNHHCGYGFIQRHSSMEKDYLKNGFWALSKEEELPTPGLSVQFLIRIEDVSKKVNKKIKNAKNEEERDQLIREIAKEIEQKAIEGTHYEASVRSYFGGNEFYLLVYERYTDVRMVAAPPVSIGDFGSLTDNWMWPRHKADFSMFRVYMSKDGKPADYAADNVPLKPRHFLPVSLKGIQEGDFAMILGYPGRTDRFMTSYGIKNLMNIEHPNRIKIRGKKLELMNEDMESDPKIRLQYASKYKGTSNYWKYSIGQVKGLKRLNVIKEKQKTEAAFTQWSSEKKKRNAEYGNVLPELAKAYKAQRELIYANQYIREALISGSEIVGSVRGLYSLMDVLENKPEEKQVYLDGLKARSESFFKNYNKNTDRKVSIALFEMFRNDVDKKFHPEALKQIDADFQGKVDAFVDHLLNNSMLADQEKIKDFIDSPDIERIKSDPAYQLSTSIYQKLEEIQSELSPLDQKINIAQRSFIQGLREMNPDKVYYPDANFTMRVTYGQVGGYEGMDAVSFNHYTTLEGVMEKEDPTNYEFIVPAKLKELYQKKDYGKYGMNGTMPVCFITNNDITGGNSGSPVIGANGELIGLAFDGNWEGMSGDIAFEPNMQKTVSVDIRYVMFIIDKIGGAKNLIDEIRFIE